MTWQKIGVFIAFVIVLGVPLFFRPDTPGRDPNVRRLVIITPHNEQIRHEFGEAFAAWHEAEFGEPAAVEWIMIGGTSEILKMLESIYVKAFATGKLQRDGTLASDAPEPMPFDLMFGGGSYDHGRLKKGVSVMLDGEEKSIRLPMSEPAGFSAARLEAWYGENQIGSGDLYDDEQYWLGNALSSFGIVYNRDVLRELKVPEPDAWAGMRDPRLAGWVALADPRQSGSVTTTYDSILSHYGWDEGWRILRDMCANARYFSNSSSKVPLDVSRGEAAMGVAIDFYGRYQAQAVQKPGETPETSRLGYVDPRGAVLVDADPVSILAGGGDPELARRFVEFTLSELGQSLWQFHVEESDDGLGPRDFELRRMPIRRAMYDRYASRFVDRISPFESAMTDETGTWRSSISPMMAAFSIDIHSEHARAWRVLNEARERAASGELDHAVVQEMESHFYAMPTHTMSDGRELLFSPEHYEAIKGDWAEAEKDGRWDSIRIDYVRFFRGSYRQVVELRH